MAEVVLVRKFFSLTRGPTGRTRMATALAAVGALVMSGGVVMLGASTAAAESCDPSPAYTETTDWVTTSPGEGWYQVEERTIPGTDPVPEVLELQYRRLVKEAVPESTDDTWYSYSPAGDNDQDVTTGYPVGDRDADKDNGWQVNQGSHTGQYADPNFAVGVPWQEGSRQRIVVLSRPQVTPGSAAEYEYMWALEPPGDGWEPTGEVRVLQEYVPGTPAVTEYKFAFNHPAITCPDQPDPVVMPLSDQSSVCCWCGVEDWYADHDVRVERGDADL